MAKFTFVPYSIRIRKKYDDQYLKLGVSQSLSNQLLNSESINFPEIFTSFLKQLPEASRENKPVYTLASQAASLAEEAENEEEYSLPTGEERDTEGEEEERIILIKSFEREAETKEIKGIFLAGNSGEEAEVYDPASNKSVYTIDKGLAVSRPFYFRAKVSHLSDKGILVLQTLRKYGIKDAFS